MYIQQAHLIILYLNILDIYKLRQMTITYNCSFCCSLKVDPGLLITQF